MLIESETYCLSTLILTRIWNGKYIQWYAEWDGLLANI